MSKSIPNLKQRVTTLRWVLPIGFSLVAILYQLGVARWVHDSFGATTHYGVEILFFATVGPLLAFWVLTLIHQWLEEKEFAENQVRMSERRLAAITTASADAILGIDPMGRIESWNRGAELLFGYLEDEMQGRLLSELFSHGIGATVELRWLVDTVRQGGYVRGHEATCRNSENREIIVELTATDLTNDQGKSVGISVILRDITDRKRREEEIQRLNASLNRQVAERTRELAEKVDALARANAELQKLDAMRSEFVSLVSHQIRAPLTNMRGAVERMQAGCGVPNTACSRMFDILNQQAMRLDRLVQDVLNVARIETGEVVLHKEPISVLPVVKQVVDQTRARSVDRPIHLPLKPGLPLVFADRDFVAEILVNLLDNADKYSSPGNVVSIDVRADQTEVVLSVRDSGPGIPDEALGRIFDKFYRAEGGDSQSSYGYGLGLYVCRSLVKAQGGHIWAENHPDGGAVFSFTLPVWQGEDGGTDDLAD
jgi:PAS domain S-box-containing protein